MGNPSAIILQKIKTASSYNGGMLLGLLASLTNPQHLLLFGEMVPHYSLSKLALKWNFIVRINKPT